MRIVQDYISQIVGPVRSIIIAYGPTGRSRGIATLTFNNPASPAKAVQTINGIKIDGRAVKVCHSTPAVREVDANPHRSKSFMMAPLSRLPRHQSLSLIACRKPSCSPMTPQPTDSNRYSKPKSAAKDAKTAPKAKGAAPATNGPAAAKGGKGKKPARANRPKKKTADELDAEMQDYFGNESAPTNGAAQPAAAAAATNGAEPVDEVM